MLDHDRMYQLCAEEYTVRSNSKDLANVRRRFVLCSSCKLLRLCLVRLWKSSAGSINLTRQAADQITRQEGKGQQLLVYRKPEHGKESFRKLRMQTGRVSPIYYYYWCSLLKKILIYNLQLKVAALSVPMRHGKYFQCAGGEDDLTCPGGFLDEARRRPLGSPSCAAVAVAVRVKEGR